MYSTLLAKSQMFKCLGFWESYWLYNYTAQCKNYVLVTSVTYDGGSHYSKYI